MKNGLDEFKKNLNNIGRPLTIQLHNQKENSYLSSTSDKIQLKGLVNLLSLLLITYNIRAMIDSIEEHNFIFIDELRTTLKTNYLKEPYNYQTLAALFSLPLFSCNAFWIEVMAATNVNRLIIYVLIWINIIMLFLFPLFVTV